MNSQLYNSKLVCPDRFRPPPLSERARELDRGAAISLSSASDHVGQMADDERDEQHDPDHADADHQLPLVARAAGPEVHQDQPDAVERVEQDRPDQADLHQADDRVLVSADHLVVRLRGDPDQRGVQHVHQEEEEDPHSGDPVRDP